MNFRNHTGKWLMATALVSAAALYSCTKPFKDVQAVLSNNYIAHNISVQIADANGNATSPYPTTSTVTLSGEAVDKGLIYTTGGDLLNNTPGSAQTIRGAFGLAIKPYTTISENQPIRFTVNVESSGYLPATKEVIVTSKDSLQYVDINMVRIAAAPAGVSIKQQTVSGVTGGTLATAATVNVSNSSSQPVVAVSIPAGTSFKDAAGNTINTTGGLSVVAAHFSNTSGESIGAVPGGLSNIVDAEGKEKTFVLGGAVDLNVNLGATAVKSFSQPLKVDVDINPQTLNPNTGNPIQAGDVIEVWSSDAGSASWRKEGNATIFTSGGKLKATMNVAHLSTWMVAYGKDVCANPLKLTFTTNAEGATVHYITISAKGTTQILADKKVSLQNGDFINIKLPAGIDYTIRLYEGGSSSTPLVQSIDVAACAPTAALNRTIPPNRPVLYFNLATKCSNGTFLYTGAIDYKLNGTARWNPFTPSDNGTLTTTTLEWDKTYNFRIVYKGKVYERTRTVLKSEFRENTANGTWEYWGKDPAVKQTFFSAPVVCE